MANNAALSIDSAWSSVALEERLELVSKANADGVIAAAAFIALVGAVAFGFDEIALLGAAIPGSLLVIPLFTSYCWRRNKPETILRYLAARSMARRYAFAQNVHNLDVVFLFRGTLEEQFQSAKDEALAKQKINVGLTTVVAETKDVWICLLAGAVVLMSESPGGAKLEFLAQLHHDTEATPRDREDGRGREVLLGGGGPARGRRVLIRSAYPAALFVFEQHLTHLITEAKNARAAALPPQSAGQARALR